MFSEKVKIQTTVEHEITVTKIPSKITFVGNGDSLNTGTGVCAIESIGKKEDGQLIYLGSVSEFKIENCIQKSISYNFNGQAKTISGAELFAIMGGMCEESWNGNFSPVVAPE